MKELTEAEKKMLDSYEDNSVFFCNCTSLKQDPDNCLADEEQQNKCREHMKKS